MKNNLTLVICSIILVFLSSCSKDDIKITPIKITPNFDAIADIATFHGNLKGNIVVVNTQGGPMTGFADGVLKTIITQTQTESALYVNVHQAQTKNPSQFTGSDITFDNAKKHDLQSVANLKRVVDFFKSQNGKTVYVLGISFGAFMTQELIAMHGIDVADGYLIIVGRLDIDEDTWQLFSQGKYTKYTYDDNGVYTINLLKGGPGGGPTNEEERNMARLAAGLGYNRYTGKLSSISDLSKITYVYGDRDEQVGSLSTQEIQFLKKKNTHVVLSDGGNHSAAIGTGLKLLKKTFRIQ